MRMLSLLATLLVVGNIVTTARAADLTKIDRTIAKQPAYESKPTYCLLVFGPEAKTQVWLALDGNTLYADRNGNGDLTEPGERFVLVQDEYDRKRGKRLWEVGDIAAPRDKVTYTGLQVWDIAKCDAFGPGLGITVNVPIGGTRLQQSAGSFVYYHHYQLHFAGRADDAPVIHFAGPLRVLQVRPAGLSAGIKAGVEYEFGARVGTPGLGKDTAAIIDDGALMGHTDPAGTELEYTDQRSQRQRLRKTLVYD
jgi:hypothetical protein